MNAPIQVTLTFPDKDALVAFFAGKPAAPANSETAAAPVEKPKASTSAATKVDSAPGQRTAEAVAAGAPAKTAAESAQPAASAEAAPQASTAAADAIDYPTLQKAVLALHKLDPKAAVPIANSLGGATFKELKPEQWAEAHRLVVAKTNELKG